MRALTVHPGRAGSASLINRDAPAGHGELRVRIRAIGICGTDREIAGGDYGEPPPGRQHLVLGHESLGHVLDAPPGSGFQPGDAVVGIVRRPDPEPCPACAAGEWDMCRNGRYTERGIKALDGYACEEVFLEPDFAVAVDPGLGIAGVLLEPASVVAKAWDHIDHIGARSRGWTRRRVVITGAGPIGLLAALLGIQRGLEVHVVDRVTDGPKPARVRELGATYHASPAGGLASLKPDLVLECTGVGTLVLDAMEHTRPGGIVCLAGLSSGGHRVPLDLARLNRSLVLENDVVFGSVNANRTHYEAAARALAAADVAWLHRLITRRVPLERWPEALERQEGDVKVILDFGEPAR